MEEEHLYIDTLEASTDKKPENYLAVLNSGVQSFTDVPCHGIREKGRNDYHLLYIESGKGTVYHEGKQYALTEGQFVIYEPWQRQEFILEKNSVSYWIHFMGTHAAKILAECGLKGGVFTAVTPSEVSQLFPKLIHALLPSTHATETKINSLMFSVLCALTEKDDHAMFHESVRTAVLYLRKNLERNVNIEELTELCNLSRSRFMHLFKKNIGTSVHQYHLILRMEHAKKNLAAKDFSVAEVASMSGFDDPLYFSRIFKKITGMSPKEFQKAQKS